VKRVALALLCACLFACTTPLERGERRYQQGDPLAALAIWRGVESDAFEYDAAQRRIDEADALEELRPIDGGHETHARDHIAHGHVHRALPLMLLADDLVGGAQHDPVDRVEAGGAGVVALEGRHLLVRHAGHLGDGDVLHPLVLGVREPRDAEDRQLAELRRELLLGQDARAEHDERAKVRLGVRHHAKNIQLHRYGSQGRTGFARGRLRTN